MSDSAADVTPADLEALAPQQPGEDPARMTGEVGHAGTPSADALRRPTGDAAVDDALDRFEATADEPLDSQIEAGEMVHRVLQGRLADLGQE